MKEKLFHFTSRPTLKHDVWAGGGGCQTVVLHPLPTGRQQLTSLTWYGGQHPHFR